MHFNCKGEEDERDPAGEISMGKFENDETIIMAS